MSLKFQNKMIVQLNLAFLIIIICSVILTTTLFLIRQKSFFIDLMIKHGQTLCSTMAENCSYGLWADDKTELGKSINPVLSARGVILTFVEDLKGSVCYADAPQEIRAKVDLNSLLFLRKYLKEEKDGYEFFSAGKHNYIGFHHKITIEKKNSKEFWDLMAAPYKGQTMELGKVSVIFSLAEIEDEISISTLRAMELGIVLFLLFLILAFLFTQRTFKGLHSLTNATRKFAEEDYQIESVSMPKNEIQELFESFGNMAQKLKEKRKLEEKIFSMEKNASLGKLAGGIAHEFNNILTAIETEAEASLDVNTPEYYKESMINILEATGHAASITYNLLNFSKPASPQKKLVELEKLIEKSITLVRQELCNFGIQIVKVFEPDLSCLADPTQLQQVFINLFTNSRDAMRNGGLITIRAWRSGGFAELLFMDTGKGILEEDQEKVFEPFFTTKGEHGSASMPGTGLGLSVTHEIISSHEGRIWVDKDIKDGTGIRISLPCQPLPGV